VQLNWQVWRRITDICKNVYNLEDAWRQMRRIIIALNSPIICRIFIYLAIPLLQSVTSLNDQNQKRMQSKLTEVTWLYRPFFHLYLFQVFATFLKGKKQFLDGQNLRNFSGDISSQQLLIKLIYGPKSVWKKFVSQAWTENEKVISYRVFIFPSSK